VERAPLYDKVFEVEEYRWKFAAYIDLLTRCWFNYDNIYAQAEKYHNLIAPYITQGAGDKMYFSETQAHFNINEFYNGWTWLADFARERNTFIQQELTKIQNSPTTIMEGSDE
jgi:hypothetical protein